ncbi:MerR family DNA-binding transcriptional regulator [Paludibacterium denitrificans]|nr:MerR family DNA-binding transcriptional regulator [Paludibacterium denitrificans]
MKIGELATAASTPIETIRYYESQGLLPKPERTAKLSVCMMRWR